jgi:DUF4097 and DUF4098 domain-containing protein YvlB
MKMKKYIYYWISVLFMLAVASNATAWSKKYQEEFHKTYPLSATGQVEVSNVNAIKYASSKDALEETEIVINSKTDEIRIKTEFPSSKFWGNNHESSVDYTISVPKNADLNDISLVNGNLEINNAGGTVNASTVNGTLVAKDLSGETKLSTVNGTMDVDFSQLNVSKVSLSSVNGEVQLKLPSNADAKISASTVNGAISNEFGLEIDEHRWVGADLSGVIGSGHTRIDLNSVNGKIAILKK